MKIKLLIIFFVIFIFVSPALSADRVVNATEGYKAGNLTNCDDGSGWTVGKVSAAIVGMTSGDTLYVCDGAHTDPSQVVLSNGVDMEGESKAGSIITFTYTGTDGYIRGASSSPYPSGLSDGGHDISKLTFDGDSRTGVVALAFLYRTDIAIHDVTFQNIARTAIWLSGWGYSSGWVGSGQNYEYEPPAYAENIDLYNITATAVGTSSYGVIELQAIKNLNLHDYTLDNQTDSINGVGIKNTSIGWFNGGEIYNCDIKTYGGATPNLNFVLETYFFYNDFEIHNNKFWNEISLNGGLTTRASGSSWNLKIYNNETDFSNITTNAGHELSHHWLEYYGNYDHDNAVSRAVGLWHTNYTTADSLTHVSLHNNIWYNNATCAIQLTDTNGGTFDYIEIANNVIDTVPEVAWGGHGIYVYVNTDTDYLDNLTIQNNIIINADYRPVWLTGTHVEDIRSPVINYNYFDGNNVDSVLDGGATTPTISNTDAAPGITGSGNKPAPYYTLNAGSPAVDNGSDLGDGLYYGLDPSSSWPDSVTEVDQDDYGVGWEIGAYIYEPPPPAENSPAISGISFQ